MVISEYTKSQAAIVDNAIRIIRDCGALLSDKNALSEANLRGANLRGANLRGADLYGAGLYGANLQEAKSIQSVGPVGDSGRIVIAYIYGGESLFRIGCRTANEVDTRAAIDRDYANNPTGRTEYMEAIDYLVAWGKRQQSLIPDIES